MHLGTTAKTFLASRRSSTNSGRSSCRVLSSSLVHSLYIDKCVIVPRTREIEIEDEPHIVHDAPGRPSEV